MPKRGQVITSESGHSYVFIRENKDRQTYTVCTTKDIKNKDETEIDSQNFENTN